MTGRLNYFLTIVIILVSCTSVRTLSSIKSNGMKIKVRSIATNCCGFCGKQVEIKTESQDILTLQFQCKFQYQCCGACGYPDKKWYYNSATGITESFVPIFDTLELTTKYPGFTNNSIAPRSNMKNLDTSYIYPISHDDSLLINSAIHSDSLYTGKHPNIFICNDVEYLRSIRGFVKEKITSLLKVK